MPVTKDKPAPYAPASAVLSIVTRHRDKGLPIPVDAEVLARAGVSESLIPRTLQALQTLDLIDDEGKPSDVLEGIRLAPEAEYQQRLGDWLHAAYADALQFIDPATASETEIRDAFRSYKPTGQQDRMVSLFIGLFAAAGIAPEKPKPAPRKSAPKPAAPKPRRAPRMQEEPPLGPKGGSSGLPPALAGLLTDLPPQGRGWTKERRQGFITAFSTLIDYFYPIVEAEPEMDGEDAA